MAQRAVVAREKTKNEKKKSELPSTPLLSERTLLFLGCALFCALWWAGYGLLDRLHADRAARLADRQRSKVTAVRQAPLHAGRVHTAPNLVVLSEER
mgnify:CR=1 FL=1